MIVMYIALGVLLGSIALAAVAAICDHREMLHQERFNAGYYDRLAAEKARRKAEPWRLSDKVLACWLAFVVIAGAGAWFFKASPSARTQEPWTLYQSGDSTTVRVWR
jgi:hypothetical protein